MKNIKKISAFILLAAMLILISCNANDSGGESDAVENNPIGGEKAEEEIIPEIEFPHEHRDFGGETFKILIDRQWDGNHLDITDFEVEELTGDVMNDAYYLRNSLMEERYNIKLEGIRSDDITGLFSRTVRAGLDEYDAVAPRLMNAGTFAARGYGLNVLDTILTLDAPWWDQNIITDMSIAGRAYVIAGDLFIKHYDGIAMLMFNKKILSDLQLDSPYNLVNNNQWTFDNFNQMVKQGTRDLTGDGVMSRWDQYGFNTQLDFMTSMLNAAGERIISKDNDDLPFFTGYSDKIISFMDKLLEIYADDTYCRHRHGYDRDGGGGQPVHLWIFPEGRALFYWGFPRFIELGLRDMEDDFGIVPIPKWDSEQGRYYATLNNWHAYTYMMPVTISDIDRNAYILDAMSYHGRQIIRPAYYDICLQRKHTRDEESSAMLDIIFNSTVYDLGTVFGIGGWIGNLEGDMRNLRNTLSSHFERGQDRIERDIERLIEQFLDN